MKPGRPKTPTALKVLRGTYRPDRAAPNEPMPEAAIPDAPETLSPEARREWQRMAGQLCDLGLLTEIDRAALAMYCEFWADFTEASEMVEKQGKVIKTKAGNVIENPYYSIKKRSADLARAFLAEFGMTPASRARVSAVVRQERKNPFAEVV